MNNFSTTSDLKTATVNGVKLTPKEIAKILAFSNSRMQWDGKNTWMSHTSAVSIIFNFTTEDAVERERLYEEYESSEDRSLDVVISQGRFMAQSWGSLRLHTCLKKDEDGTRIISLDRLEVALGIELGDTVRERLSLVTAKKEQDDEWLFEGACGKSRHNTATEGILVAIGYAANSVERITEEALCFVRRGITDFDSIARQSYNINAERMTPTDIDNVKRAIEESGVKPEVYSAFFSKVYNECQTSAKSIVNEAWGFEQTLGEFASWKEADDFKQEFNASYRVQRTRVGLAKQVKDAEEQLEQLRKKLAELS